MPALKDMADPFVSPVVILTVTGQHPLHDTRRLFPPGARSIDGRDSSSGNTHRDKMAIVPFDYQESEKL